MASFIGRRKFLATLGGAAAAWPLAARAQQAGRMYRIGFFGGGLETSSGDGWEKYPGALRASLCNGLARS
jgi:hypothetical protein